MIYENGNVIHDFSKLSLTHCFCFFFFDKNNLLAGVSKGKCYLNSVTFCFYSTGKIVSLGVPLLCMCVHMSVVYF